LNEENRKLDAKRNEYNLLKSLIDSMEGYPDSIKFLHNNPSWNHGAPVLSDILYVKEEYRTAVENLLEPYLNYYVTANLQEGLQAVQLLDNNRKGKANFFLLDAFSSYSRSVSQPAQTIRALDVVEVDGKYARLAEYLLGHVFIAENETALEQSGTGDAVILEKSGKYVKGRFTLSGGSIGLFEGKKIGRVKNLEKLAEDISDQEAVVNLLKSDIQAKHQEVIAFNDQLKEKAIRETEQLINRITNELFAARNRMENLQMTAQSSLQRFTELEKRGEEEQAAIAATRALLGELSDEMLQTGASLKNVESDYQQSELEYNQHVFQLNETNLLLTKQQSKIAGLQQELSFKKNQLTDLENQITLNKTQLEESVAAITESTNQLETAAIALQEMIIRKEAEEKRLNEVDQAFYVLRNTMQDKETALRSRIKNKEQVDQQIQLLKDQVNELKLQLAGMKERLQVEFKINLDDIIEEGRNTETPLEELQSAADRMRKRMENMGDVNPTAIEAFTEMKKRYEFILEQKNDLVSARESLMKTIDEVEATANQQFLDTFNQVRENFQRVFKALFTEEDTADMVLINPDNLAETGIDIIAKPKGKKPSSITQLSGGEKTLTATALLFSIYLIKPAPFCIMDEVDAPLDDANVGKFTQMIKKFSDNSQFIIVTHNKQTMSAVDVIYGVTMQEPGVSKLVPVDFRSLAN
jgi:chromosome segregation protein